MKIFKLFFLIITLTVLLHMICSYPFIPQPAKSIPSNCRSNCSVNYGAEVGSFSRVPAYSNCNNECVNTDDEGVYFPRYETGFLDDVYVGIRWQCVEYARRWLIVNKNVSFESIDNAYEIFDIPKVFDLEKANSTFPFVSYTNENIEPPQIGDLLIWKKSSLSKYGHVAVVSGINLDNGYLQVAEQNWDQSWKNSSYSRRIVISQNNNKYIVKDETWVSPLTIIRLDYYEVQNDVIGWKRVFK